MAVHRYIGIDIGNSATIVKIRDTDRGRGGYKDKICSLKIDGEMLIPSIAFVAGDDFGDPQNFYFGKVAESCHLEGKLYTDFKTDLLSEDVKEKEKARRLIALFLVWLKANYDEQEMDYFGKCDNVHTVIGYPAKWTAELRDFMKDAALWAGFQDVQGKDEASAAVEYAIYSELGFGNEEESGIPQRVLLADLGAGTPNFAMGTLSSETCSFAPQIIYPEIEDGICYGGKKFDDGIFEFVCRYLSENGYELGRQNYQTIYSQCRQWKEESLSPCLKDCRTISSPPAFIELLLNGNYNQILFPVIDRTYFEGLFKQELNCFVDNVECIIRKAADTGMGIHSIDDIDLIILTGGHSQWYFVYDYLSGRCSAPDGRSMAPKWIKGHRSRLVQCASPRETVALGLICDRGVLCDSRQGCDNKETKEKEDINMNEELKLNLLVAGKAGVGKTTLINTIFNAEIGEVKDDKPATVGIEKLSIPYFPINIYDVQGFELKNAEATMKMIRDKISKEQVTVKAERLIHAILYCINAPGRRFEAIDPDDASRGQEEKFIRQLIAEYKVPVFVVFTQAYALKTEDNDTIKLRNFINSVKSCGMPVQGYYPLLCERSAGIDPFGVNELVDDLLRVLPRQMAELIAGARERALKIKHDEAVNWIWKYAAGNFALGAIIPAGADVAYLMAIEGAMAIHITAILYKDTDVEIKDVIAEIVATVGGPMLGAVGGQIAFNEVIKVGSYILTVVTGGLGAGAAAAAAFAGGLIAAAITVAMGRTYLWIAEGLVSGKIDKEKVKNKDPKVMKQIENVMKSSYAEARKQVDRDERFSKSNFGKSKK